MKHPDDMLEVDRLCFIKTGNPMFVWQAYALARHCNTPVPDWLLVYFDKAAHNLIDLSIASQASGGKDLGPKVAKAIGLASKGRGSPLVAYHADWMAIGMTVRARVAQVHEEGRQDSETNVIDAVADERRLAPATVHRAYKLYDEMFPGPALFPDETITGV